MCLSFLYLLYVNFTEAVNLCSFSCHLNHRFWVKSNYGMIWPKMLQHFCPWMMPQLLIWTKWCFWLWASENKQKWRQRKSRSPPALHRNDSPSSGLSFNLLVCLASLCDLSLLFTQEDICVCIYFQVIVMNGFIKQYEIFM